MANSVTMPYIAINPPNAGQPSGRKTAARLRQELQGHQGADLHERLRRLPLDAVQRRRFIAGGCVRVQQCPADVEQPL